MGIYTVNLRKACKRCRFTFLNNYGNILWEGTEFINPNGSLISEEEAIPYINDYYRAANFECRHCGNIGEFHIWDVSIDGENLIPRKITESEKKRIEELSESKEDYSIAIGAIYNKGCLVCMSTDGEEHDFLLENFFKFVKVKDNDLISKRLKNKIIFDLRNSEINCVECGSIGHWEIFKLGIKLMPI